MKNTLVTKVRNSIRHILSGLLPGSDPRIEVKQEGQRMLWTYSTPWGEMDGYATFDNATSQRDLCSAIAAEVAMRVGGKIHPAGGGVYATLEAFQTFGPGLPIPHAMVLLSILKTWKPEEELDAAHLVAKALPEITELTDQLLVKIKENHARVHVHLPEGAPDNAGEEHVGTAPNGVPGAH